MVTKKPPHFCRIYHTPSHLVWPCISSENSRGLNMPMSGQRGQMRVWRVKSGQIQTHFHRILEACKVWFECLRSALDSTFPQSVLLMWRCIKLLAIITYCTYTLQGSQYTGYVNTILLWLSSSMQNKKTRVSNNILWPCQILATATATVVGLQLFCSSL